MLNPELFKVFGSESKEFFEEFIKRVGEGLASRCYAVVCGCIQYGNTTAPNFIYADVDEHKLKCIDHECLETCFYFQEKYDVLHEDELTMCYNKDYGDRKVRICQT